MIGVACSASRIEEAAPGGCDLKQVQQTRSMLSRRPANPVLVCSFHSRPMCKIAALLVFAALFLRAHPNAAETFPPGGELDFTAHSWQSQNGLPGETVQAFS